MENNSAINISLSEQEHARFKAYANFHGETIASLVLKSLRTAMEDWEDVQDAEEILARNEPSIPWSEVQRRAGF